eukprot:GEMP01083809.1.p1 GENE.GEMP01083809.1~~GEMP01083809.1.p1  ORF type:complete len:239 (+),score=36.68 GEMP01083809.1:293-1009(+)
MLAPRFGRRFFATHYEILKVLRNASARAIKTAYRKEARRVHPDRPGGSTEAFKKLQNAHEILSHADKRRAYDESIRTGTPYRYRDPDAEYRRPAQQPEPAAFDANQILMYFVMACGLGVLLSSMSREEDIPVQRYNMTKSTVGDPNVQTIRAYWNPVAQTWERLSESQGPPMVLDFVNFYQVPYEQRYLLPRHLREENRPIEETVEPMIVQDLTTRKTIRVGKWSSQVAKVHPDAIQF